MEGKGLGDLMVRIEYQVQHCAAGHAKAHPLGLESRALRVGSEAVFRPQVQYCLRSSHLSFTIMALIVFSLSACRISWGRGLAGEPGPV